ncbi:MAG: sulfatase-like hydrolase/transferase [Pseudomonadota bacterium]
MGKTKNILFIMYDQLRWDYLSCAGHPTLETPNFDRLAKMGVRFDRAYVQSPVCGASRMSFYTGRYCQSHGAQWNGYPLRVGELTLGDHLREAGMECWLIGKTHMRADEKGMARLGLAPDSMIGARLAECGFDTYIRDDGLHAKGPDGWYYDRVSPYNEYLREQGYEAENAWHDFANSGVDEEGDVASGFLMQHAGKPANVREEDSETTWLTTQAIEFIETHDEKPWCAHVSYIKPHWPYVVPAPYHNMYGHNHIKPVVRSDDEWRDMHPVMKAFADGLISKAFHRDEVREAVIPAYMGLIKQCDDQLGRLLDHLEDTGRIDETMIVLTSDHGDYLGDHWKGEKDLFHECSVRVPMIVYDPDPRADETRGTVSDALVESIDCAATFVAAAGGEVPDHILEGRSLLQLLHGETPGDWRDYVISEYDYGMMPIAAALDVAPKDARLFMVADHRWKFMHAEGGFRPMLFDMENDPDELDDLCRDNRAPAEVIEMMYDRLFEWARRVSQRITMSDADIIAKRGRSRRRGIVLGAYDMDDVDPEIMSTYMGKAGARPPD